MNVHKWQMLHVQRRPDIETEYSLDIDHLRVLVREDPSRVRIPLYDTNFGCVPTKDVSEITKDRGAWHGRTQGTYHWR